eukprot:13923625-Alexandrium_andersonii.AAC.1
MRADSSAAPWPNPLEGAALGCAARPTGRCATDDAGPTAVGLWAGAPAAGATPPTWLRPSTFLVAASCSLPLPCTSRLVGRAAP